MMAAPLGAFAEGLDFLEGWDGRHDRSLAGWELQLSPYTLHFSMDPNHKNVWLIGGAKVREDGWMLGGAYFSNSFGQPSGYGFAGRKYLEPFGWKDVTWSWTAGILYGYKGEYKHKVPLNYGGFSPGFVPMIAYKLTPETSGQLALLGNSGVMFSVVFNFDQNKK